MDTERQRRLFTRCAGGLWCAAALAFLFASPPAFAQAAGDRLDRAERVQLRSELGRQSRQGGERRADASQGDGRRNADDRMLHRRDGGWQSSNAPYRERADSGRNPENPDRADRRRMTPEEREQLRSVLRQHRQRRSD